MFQMRNTKFSQKVLAVSNKTLSDSFAWHNYFSGGEYVI